jgi:outer membrane protein OmpA-like peptidoglycan-associated protein
MRKIFLLSLLALVTLSFLVGCAGRVYAPREGSAIWYYHPELPEAAKAVEDAQKAGKDTLCPEEFQAAKHLMEDAYRTYWACHTQEGIDMAKEATAMANALCPPPAACSLTASPTEIQKGESATITFSTSGKVKYAVLDGEEVAVTGTTKTVNPTTSTTYSGMVTGLGGMKTCGVAVTVACPPPPPPCPPPPACPPPPPAPKVIDRLTIHVNFDFDKSDIREADMPELQKAIDFVKKYPGSKVKLEGYTDSKGTEEYNQKLSERRAGAVEQYLIKEGAVESSKISAEGYGEANPIAPNKTPDGKDNPEGRAQNRRVEILIMSD